MGEYIHTKFWMGGDVRRAVAKHLLTAIAEEEMNLGYDPYENDRYEPKSIAELLKNRVDGVVALFEHEKNYGDCATLEDFCKENGIAWRKWHTSAGGWLPAFYWWEPGMSGEETLITDEDQNLLIPKAKVDEAIKILEIGGFDTPSTERKWKENVLNEFYLASPQVPELKPFCVLDDESEENAKLKKAVGMLREAADMVSAMDVQARNAILNLATDLEPPIEKEGD